MVSLTARLLAYGPESAADEPPGLGIASHQSNKLKVPFRALKSRDLVARLRQRPVDRPAEQNDSIGGTGQDRFGREPVLERRNERLSNSQNRKGREAETGNDEKGTTEIQPSGPTENSRKQDDKRKKMAQFPNCMRGPLIAAARQARGDAFSAMPMR